MNIVLKLPLAVAMVLQLLGVRLTYALSTSRMIRARTVSALIRTIADRVIVMSGGRDMAGLCASVPRSVGGRQVSYAVAC
jgi:hypothetical protein